MRALLVTVLVMASAPAAAAAERIVLLDASSQKIDQRIRRTVISHLRTAFSGEPGVTVVPARAPTRPVRRVVDELIGESRTLSEAFKEEEALDVLRRAERLYRERLGQVVAVEPLIHLYLERARILADLGRLKDVKEVLTRLIVLDPAHTLDPAAFPPRIMTMFRRLVPKLTAKRGNLRVKTAPPGQIVWLDGVRRGTAPLEIQTVAGEHFLTAGAPAEATGQAVIVKAGEHRTVTIELPEKRQLSDTELRSNAARVDADWLAAVQLLHKDRRYRIKVRLVPATPTTLPRGIESPRYVPEERLTWASGQIALRILEAVSTRPQQRPVGSARDEQGPRDDEAPVWRRWWFWTAIGVAVAGAITTSTVLLTRDDPGVRLVIQR
jgi:hypothetical protein